MFSTEVDPDYVCDEWYGQGEEHTSSHVSFDERLASVERHFPRIRDQVRQFRRTRVSSESRGFAYKSERSVIPTDDLKFLSMFIRRALGMETEAYVPKYTLSNEGWECTLYLAYNDDWDEDTLCALFEELVPYVINVSHEINDLLDESRILWKVQIKCKVDHSQDADSCGMAVNEKWQIEGGSSQGEGFYLWNRPTPEKIDDENDEKTSSKGTKTMNRNRNAYRSNHRRAGRRGWDDWESLKRAIGVEDALLELLGWIGDHEAREVFEFIARMHDLPLNVQEQIENSRQRSGEILENIEPFFRDLEQLADEVAQGVEASDLRDAVEDAARMWDVRLSRRRSAGCGGECGCNGTCDSCAGCSCEDKRETASFRKESIPSLSRNKALQMDKGSGFYAEFDDLTDMWCVFGSESGFCYEQFYDKYDAKDKAGEMERRFGQSSKESRRNNKNMPDQYRGLESTARTSNQVRIPEYKGPFKIVGLDDDFEVSGMRSFVESLEMTEEESRVNEGNTYVLLDRNGEEIGDAQHGNFEYNPIHPDF